MFNTIKTWIHRIRNYDKLCRNLKIENRKAFKNRKENECLKVEVNNLKRELEEWKKESDERYKALIAMANILSEGTWKE